MNIIYMGSPTEAIHPLQALLDEQSRNSKLNVVAVVSAKAQKSGRGKKLLDPPVAKFAKQNKLLTLQPEKAKDLDFIEQIKGLNPDVIITCAYGHILTNAFLEIPSRATINIHPSLLPKFRGATPVQSTLLQGCTTTGVSILFTVKALDAGNIICQQSTKIDPQETSDQLMDRLFRQSCPMLFEALKKLEDKSFTGVPQDETKVSLCRKIKKEDGLIDWHDKTASIMNRFKAHYPWPGSYSYLEQKRVIITGLENTDYQPTELANTQSGLLTYIKAQKSLYVSCLDGHLKITKLRVEGAKELDAVSFWNGLKKRNDLKLESK